MNKIAVDYHSAQGRTEFIAERIAAGFTVSSLPSGESAGVPEVRP